MSLSEVTLRDPSRVVVFVGCLLSRFKTQIHDTKWNKTKENSQKKSPVI